MQESCQDFVKEQHRVAGAIHRESGNLGSLAERIINSRLPAEKLGASVALLLSVRSRMIWLNVICRRPKG